MTLDLPAGDRSAQRRPAVPAAGQRHLRRGSGVHRARRHRLRPHHRRRPIYDNDGDVDLFMVEYTHNDPREQFYLLLNDGQGHFTDVADAGRRRQSRLAARAQGGRRAGGRLRRRRRSRPLRRQPLLLQPGRRRRHPALRRSPRRARPAAPLRRGPASSSTSTTTAGSICCCSIRAKGRSCGAYTADGFVAGAAAARTSTTRSYGANVADLNGDGFEDSSSRRASPPRTRILPQHRRRRLRREPADQPRRHRRRRDGVRRLRRRRPARHRPARGSAACSTPATRPRTAGLDRLRHRRGRRPRRAQPVRPRRPHRARRRRPASPTRASSTAARASWPRTSTRCWSARPTPGGSRSRSASTPGRRPSS